MTPPHRLILSLSLLTFLPILHSLPAIPDSTTQLLQQFLPSSSPPLTIPANPEQSDLTACPLHLSDDLYHGIESACTGKHNSGKQSRNQAGTYTAPVPTNLREIVKNVILLILTKLKKLLEKNLLFISSG